VATGDGIAIAYEAGAVLSDMEFVQFHPTALAIKGAPRFLLSEALRGEGGVLRNINLERFMKRYAEAQELAPRDVVARAIVSEMQRTHAEHVYLDMTAKSAEFLQKRFPRIYATCLSYGLDLATDMAPVCPAAHYMMGGVKTDLWGRTSLPGLYAAGETADTGVHGANRLASNSLLEGLVFGARSGQAMIADCPAIAHQEPASLEHRSAVPSAKDRHPVAHKVAHSSVRSAVVTQNPRSAAAIRKDVAGIKHKIVDLPGSPAPKPDSLSPEPIAAGSTATSSARSASAHSAKLVASKSTVQNHNSRTASSAIAEHSANHSASGSKNSAHESNPHPTAAALAQLRDLMWRNVGIMRNGKDLAAAIASLRSMQVPRSPNPDRHDYELSNLLCLASLMARSALAREESRGSHYRSDFPYREDDLFQKHSLVQRSKDLTFEP
jgi:aspartate oxidase